MIIILSSPKAGNGTSTTAALLALTSAHEQSTVLVDLAGDQPTILESPAIDGVIYIQPRLELINAARMTLAEQIDTVHAIDADRKHVIIDAGTHDHPIHDHLPSNTVVTWVLRPCYLTLRHAGATTRRPSNVVMLTELGRALTAPDIEAVLGSPVIATIDIHPEISRAVDAGLLATRPLRRATRPLETLIRTTEPVD